MANQRKETKKQVSAYVDIAVKEEIAKTGLTDSAFAEWSYVHGLLIRKIISAAKIRDWARDGKITDNTLLMLEREGLLK
jgi:hypothetical protein